MGFHNPWYLLFLTAVPTILLMYMLKLRAEDKRFSSLLLWKEAYKSLQASSPWEKLKSNLLMYLQILLAVLIALALASPYLKRESPDYDRAVIVVDVSASMNAVYDGERTRLDAAVEEALDYIDSLREGTRLAILSIDQKAVIHAADISDREQASRILSTLKAADLAGNPDAALNAVASVMKQDENCEVVFFTDGGFDISDIENARISGVNSMGVNGCIDYVSASFRNGGMEALARVSNPSPFELNSDVNLYVDGELADIGEISLAPDESGIVFFEVPVDTGSVVKAELNQKDLLEADNSAYALLNERAESRALLITPGNTFLEKAISLVEGLELYKSAELVDFGAAPDFDLYIFDGVVPDELPESGNFILINPRREVPGVFSRWETMERVSVTAADTSVTGHIGNYSFGVARVDAAAPPPWGKSFFMAGNLSAGYYGEYEGRMAGVICFDLHDSDFALKTEFPIFIHNLATQFSYQGMLYGHRYSTGDILKLRPGMSGPGLSVINPMGEAGELSLSGSSASYGRLDYAGIYRVTDGVDMDIPFIVSFPTAFESRVEADGPEAMTGEAAKATGLGKGREVRSGLIICALLLLLVEWAVYLRRRA